MDISASQENTYANICEPNEATGAVTRMGNSSKDVRSKRRECSVDSRSLQSDPVINRVNKGNGKWKTLRTGLIVAVVIIAFIVVCLGPVALVKILNAQTELKALRRKNSKLNQKFENLLINYLTLNESLTNLSENFELKKQFYSLITTNSGRLAVLSVQADPGWYTPNKGYQYMLSRDSQTWNNSRAWCEKMGGDLATAGMKTYNMRRYAVVTRLMKNENAWVGLHDTTQEENFVWFDAVVTTKSKEHPNRYKGN